jgi:hypothetical protein
MMKKVKQDPFSNGSDHRAFEFYCCDKCVKSSEPRDGGMRYTNSTKDNMPKCSIQRDIVLRMFSNVPINQHTIDICRDFILHGTLCPYMKTERKKYTRKVKNQTTLVL